MFVIPAKQLHQTMKKLIPILTLLPLIAWAATPNEKPIDCKVVSDEVAKEIQADKSKVLDIVAKNAEKYEGCACEIVKTAILTTKANNKLVGDIVEKAILAAPSQAEIIVQCAAAVAPLAYLEINAGAAAAGSDARVGDNPLNFPGDNQNPPTEGEGVNPPSGVGGNLGNNGVPNVPVITDPNP